MQKPPLLLQKKPSQIHNNSFANKIPKLQNVNTNAQFVLNVYVVAIYYSSYMTKVDNSMTYAFKIICKDHQQDNINAIRMISTLINALLNLQQMSSQ